VSVDASLQDNAQYGSLNVVNVVNAVLGCRNVLGHAKMCWGTEAFLASAVKVT
jgi:hypothetical protein